MNKADLVKEVSDFIEKNVEEIDGEVDLGLASTSIEEFNYGDNLTVAPNGHLVVCEDQYTENVHNHLRGITSDGVAYPLALSRTDTEWAGACFSPDGKVLFANLYRPAKTVAITGPWAA